MSKIFYFVTFYLSFFAFLSSQNIDSYNIMNDFSMRVDLPKKILLNRIYEGRISFSNRGGKSWDSVQFDISVTKSIDIFKSSSWILEQIKPYEKGEIHFKIRSRSVQNFICNMTLVAKAKSNYLSVAKSVTKHGVLRSLEADSPIKYDTQDPIFVNEMTTYVLEIDLNRYRDIRSILLINEIDENMDFVKASGPTQYWFDKEKKVVIFFPIIVKKRKNVITYKITCRAIRGSSVLNRMLVWVNFLDRPILFEEPTSVISD